MSFRNFESKGEQPSDISKRIKELRRRENESQGELAKMINCTKNTIANIEQDKSAPSLDVAIQLAKHFAVSLDYLCGLTDDEKISTDILNVLCNYISLETEHRRMSQPHEIPFISINKNLFNYLKVLDKAWQLKHNDVPDDVIKAWIEKEAQKAANSLRICQQRKTQKKPSKNGIVEKFPHDTDETISEERIKFALLSERDISSDEAMNLIERTYKESRG